MRLPQSTSGPTQWGATSVIRQATRPAWCESRQERRAVRRRRLEPRGGEPRPDMDPFEENLRSGFWADLVESADQRGTVFPGEAAEDRMIGDRLQEDRVVAVPAIVGHAEISTGRMFDTAERSRPPPGHGTTPSPQHHETGAAGDRLGWRLRDRGSFIREADSR